MSERTEQEVQYTLAHTSAALDGPRRHPHDLIRNQEIVNACQTWLELKPDERAAWLLGRMNDAAAYQSVGDNGQDVEASSRSIITEWLAGMWEWSGYSARPGRFVTSDAPTLYHRYLGHVYRIKVVPHTVEVERQKTGTTPAAKCIAFGTVTRLRNGTSWNDPVVERLIDRYEQQLAADLNTTD